MWGHLTTHNQYIAPALTLLETKVNLLISSFWNNWEFGGIIRTLKKEEHKVLSLDYRRENTFLK